MNGRKLFLLSVRDSAVQAFNSPMCVPAIGVATRSFVDECKRAESPMAQHPEDYELWHVGFFDEDTGELTPMKPECVLRGKDASS